MLVISHFFLSSSCVFIHCSFQKHQSVKKPSRLCLGSDRSDHISLASVCRRKLSWNSLFLLETLFSNSKLTFLTQNSLFLLETHFSYSKLTFLTRNSLFLLKTRFSYSKRTTRKIELSKSQQWERSGSMVECLAWDWRAGVRASPASLRCVIRSKTH